MVDNPLDRLLDIPGFDLLDQCEDIPGGIIFEFSSLFLNECLCSEFPLYEDFLYLSPVELIGFLG